VPERGLVIVYTGGGKGKTTAALGLALRACGYGSKTCMIQFIKGSWHYGEMTSSKRLEPDFELIAAGKGFVGIIDDKSPKEEHVRVAGQALKLSRDRVLSDKYDNVILDEVNYAVSLSLICVEDLISLIHDKPHRLNLILTGNQAAPEVLKLADLVTEMREIKHPFRSGIKARRGIDF